MACLIGTAECEKLGQGVLEVGSMGAAAEAMGAEEGAGEEEEEGARDEGNTSAGTEGTTAPLHRTAGEQWQDRHRRCHYQCRLNPLPA